MLAKFSRLHTKLIYTCSAQLPNQDIIIGDAQGYLVRRNQNGDQKIINKYTCAVRALAVLPHNLQFVIALEDGRIQLRDFDDKITKEFKVNDKPDFLAVLPNESLLIKTQNGSFGIYDNRNFECKLKFHEGSKPLAHIPNSYEFIFQDSKSLLSIRELKITGFVHKRSIHLSEEVNIQALQMLFANVCVVAKEKQMAVWKLNERDITQISEIQSDDMQFIGLHLPTATKFSSRTNASFITPSKVQSIDLACLFPDIIRLLNQASFKIAGIGKVTLQLMNYAGGNRKLSSQVPLTVDYANSERQQSPRSKL